MTVRELQEKLNNFPDDTLVVVKGYEEGYNDISEIRELKMKLNVYEHWFEGAHEESDEAGAINALVFFGTNKNAKE
jgi:hypothetical protein